eukprot:TRINITY_DN5851_c1_g1_i1.p1 TRINITY_DN5851_c1_g1~~TRINITY_DN5851_c1_g1_i1.p1  ORF type:complete len:310 (+),score=49.47 TRINITY_DN5851_c1_g1_i1:94-1023(+)
MFSVIGNQDLLSGNMRTFPSQDTRTPQQKRLDDENIFRETPVAAADMAEAEYNGGLVREFFGDFLRGMQFGTIAEMYDKWLHDDVVWDTLDMPLPLFAFGKKDCVIAYNIICENVFGGPSSTVTLCLENQQMLSKDRFKMCFSVSIKQKDWTTSMVERRQFHVKLRDGKIQHMIVTPGFTTQQTYGAVDEPCISPVQVPRSVAPQNEETASSCGLSSESDKVPELPPPTLERPCMHNDWDSVRIKRQFALLRCRVCSSQWKIKATEVRRCNTFMDGGCHGDCELLHVNSRKQTQSERIRKHMAASNSRV